MELFRQKNQPTTFVFPLISSGSNSYYNTSAWSSLTNSSISAYTWGDTSAPVAQSMSQVPSQLSATGLWSLSATAGEMNPAGNYMAIKLKADQIQEQSLLVILTSYQIQNIADSSNKVNSNAVSVSAYTNFPQVTVSANLDKTNYTVSSGSINNVTGNVSGSVNSVVGSVIVGTNNDKTGYTVTAGTINTITNQVSVSAQTNHPVVSVSAYTNFPQVYVSAGQVTNVTGNVSGSVNNLVVNPTVTVGQVTVSAYNNFPQVYVSAGNITNVTGNVSGSVNNVIVPQSVTVGQVTVSAYNNFPSVNVSAITDGIITSADYATDYYNKLTSLLGSPTFTIGKVQVSGIDGGLFIGTSAYQNFPQVSVSAQTNHPAYPAMSVSANTDKIGYSLSNSVTVSAYTNFPQVQVSGLNNNTITSNVISANSFTSADFATDYYTKVQSLDTVVTIGKVQVSGIDGGLYVGTSAYTNFPQVTVSTNLDKTNYTVSSGSITAVAGNVTGSVASVTGSVGSVAGNVTGSVNSVVNAVSVSAQTNHPGVSVSAYTNFPQVTVSAINAGLTITNTTNVVNAVSVSAQTNHPQVSVSANSDKTGYSLGNSVTVSAYTNFPSVNVSSVNAGVLTSADFATDYYNKVQSLDTVVTIGQVQVSGINSGIYVGTSAYNNFPQVYVSANGDKTGYSINSIPQVQVSGMNNSVINQIQNGLASASDNQNIQTTVNAISAVTNQFTFSGTSVNAYSTNELAMPGAVTVSAYTNFPQVQVSGINNDIQLSASIGDVNVTSIDSGVYVGTSAYTNFPNVQVSGMTSGSINDILNGIVDTKTLTEIFTVLFANAVGNVDRNSNVFTYYKQDGLTSAFENTMTSISRRRTN